MVGFRKKAGRPVYLHTDYHGGEQLLVRGTADSIYQNLDWLKKSHEPYVVIASGDAVYKMDYNKVLEYHIDKKADITVVCKDMPAGTDVSRFGVLDG